MPCTKQFPPNPYEIWGELTLGPTCPSVSCGVRGEKQGRRPWILQISPWVVYFGVRQVTSWAPVGGPPGWTPLGPAQLCCCTDHEQKGFLAALLAWSAQREALQRGYDHHFKCLMSHFNLQQPAQDLAACPSDALEPQSWSSAFVPGLRLFRPWHN